MQQSGFLGQINPPNRFFLGAVCFCILAKPAEVLTLPSCLSAPEITPMENLGRHIIAELTDCNPDLLRDVHVIEQLMVQAAEAAHATVINATFHHFAPFGVSGVVVIQESHLAIHTWPEYRYAAVDVFTCGDTVNPWDCYLSLKKTLESGSGSAIEMHRGQAQLLPDAEEDTALLMQMRDDNKPAIKRTRDIWFTERDDNTAQSFRHKGDILYRKQTPYQKVEVIDTFAYGKMLTLDDYVMTTEKDEFAYHEMLTHPAAQLQGAPTTALVIGGGDGGVVRECLRYAGIARVVLVEIDAAVVEASRQYLPSIAGQLDDPRVEIQHIDGAKYVAEAADRSFDLILVDSTDPSSISDTLFGEQFYKNAARVLREGGYFAAQSESPRYHTEQFLKVNRQLRSVFGANATHTYLLHVPTYPSGLWSMTLAGKRPFVPKTDLNAEKADTFAAAQTLKYYNADIHAAAFALPNYVREILQQLPANTSPPPHGQH